jgi:hypothetical protein
MTTEQWILDTVEKGGGLPYWKLCVAWAREVGTSGNVVTWPKPIVSRVAVRGCGMIDESFEDLAAALEWGSQLDLTPEQRSKLAGACHKIAGTLRLLRLAFHLGG